jgi:hypothetical protein
VDLLRVASRSCGKPNLGLPDFRPGSLNSRKYFPRIGLEEAGLIRRSIHRREEPK